MFNIEILSVADREETFKVDVYDITSGCLRMFTKEPKRILYLNMGNLKSFTVSESEVEGENLNDGK
jgi:hypothetical protein